MPSLPVFSSLRFGYFCHVRAYSQEFQDMCDNKNGKIILVFTHGDRMYLLDDKIFEAFNF